MHFFSVYPDSDTPITKLSLTDFRQLSVMMAEDFLSLQGERAEEDVLDLIVSTRFADKRPIPRVAQVGGHQTLTAPVTISLLACPDSVKLTCLSNDLYRSIGGECNNKLMIDWGSNTSKLTRELGPLYSDNINQPRGGRESAGPHCGPVLNTSMPNPGCVSDPKRLLPNPRRVSVEFHTPRGNQLTPPTYNTLFIFFSQFLDHDITLTPEVELENNGKCCRPPTNASDMCFNIYHPPANNSENNPAPDACNYFPEEAETSSPPPPDSVQNFDISKTCMSFRRSVNFCNAPDSWEQCNMITAYIDSSNVYTSNPEDLKKIREFSGGRMKMAPNNLLPFLDNDPNNIKAGDVRALENIMITTLHTIFLREHNRLAAELQKALPDAPDEDLFQEARRIVWAEFQSIVYGSFLLRLLGEKTMEEYDLYNEIHDRYDPDLNPGITNEFATAAYRFAHSALPIQIDLRDIETGQIKEKLSLRQFFFNTTLYYQEQGKAVEEIINGMMFQYAEKVNKHFTKEVTDQLFSNFIRFGHDLAARNLQRGRDHGLQGYLAYRAHFGLESACTWEVPPPEIDMREWNILSKLYTAPADIDLFTGGLAERQHGGSLVGVTFNKILAKQFHALKFGDR